MNVQARDTLYKKNYRKDLDGLRAIAVLAVIINHFEKSLLPSGFLGVDVFFVISGYVITSSLITRETGTFGNFISAFYSRRVKRLLPALTIVVLVTGILTITLIYKPGISIITAFYSLIGFSNYILYQESTDYFSASSELNTLMHTWSLGVEEQFYFVYPIIFWLCIYHKKNKTLIYVISILSIISLSTFIFLNHNNQSAAYFLTPARFWELGSGCLTYFVLSKYKVIVQKIKIPSFIFISLLLVSFFIPLQFRSSSTIIIVFLTATLIIFITKEDLSYKLLTKKYVNYIGLISYSLYLWHWPILSLSRWTSGIHWYTVFWQIPLILLLSVLTHKYVENIFRKMNWSKTNTTTILYGFGISITSILILGSSYYYRDIILIKKFPWKSLTPLHKKLACHLPNYENPILECLSCSEKNKKVIYIIGDSHAGNMVNSVQKATENKMVVKYLTDRALALSIFNYEGCGGTNCSENEFQSRLDFFSKNLKEGDIIMFSIARDRLYRNTNNYPKNRRDRLINANIEYLKSKLRGLGKLVNRKNATLLLIDDIPKLCDQYETAVRKTPLNPCPILQKTSIEDRQPLTKIYKSLVNPYTKYLDPHPILCPDETCYAIFNNKLLYTDASPHISENNADVLTDFFKTELKKMKLK